MLNILFAICILIEEFFHLQTHNYVFSFLNLALIIITITVAALLFVGTPLHTKIYLSNSCEPFNFFFVSGITAISTFAFF